MIIWTFSTQTLLLNFLHKLWMYDLLPRDGMHAEENFPKKSIFFNAQVMGMAVALWTSQENLEEN